MAPNIFIFLKGSKLGILCVATSLFASGILINLVQGILYLSLRPFNKWLYRKLNWYLCWIMNAQVVAIFDWWSQSKTYLYVDKDIFDKYVGREHAFIIGNHSYEIDGLPSMVLADKVNVLGNMKAIIKKPIQYLPVIGWTWKFGESVYLERNFDKDKYIINKQIKELAEHPDPMWLLIFPEATRFTQEKHIASAEYAAKNNLPQLKYHLQPRTRGFTASLPSMRGKISAIYNREVAFKEDDPYKPTLTNLLLGNPIAIHMYIHRIPLDEVPVDPQEQETFLRNMFVQKDKLKESFHKTGDFFTTSGVPKVEQIKFKPQLYSLVNFIFWQIVTLVPLSYYLAKFLVTGQFLYFSIIAGIIGFSILKNMAPNLLNFLKGSKLGMMRVAIPFFVSGLIVNIVQCTLYFSLGYLNMRLYRKVNWYLCWIVNAQVTAMFDWWSQSETYLYIEKDIFDKYVGEEHAMIIQNHSYETDWLTSMVLADNVHTLGNAKGVIKKVGQYFPVIGWTWKFGESIYLDRNFDKDKYIINKKITQLAEHPDPMWLTLCPEGTRFTKEKQVASAEFAYKNNLPQLKYHLQPRTRGFIASIPSMRGKIPAIYNIEVGFKEDDPFKPNVTNLLLGNPVVNHMYLQRIPLEEVPVDPKEQETFLRNIFVQKDKLRESFLKTGDFFTTSDVPRVEPIKLKPQLYSLVNFIFWQIFTLVLLSYYFVKFLVNGQFLYFSIGAGIIGLIALLLKLVIDMNTIKKGSSYGLEATTKKTQ